MNIREGWGLTHVDNYKGTGKTYFIVSDGSENIYIVDPEDFSVYETILITYPL
jgi:glutamine cyclotransferase